MQSFLTFILALLIVHSHAQEFNYPVVTKNGQSIQDFVPAGWVILDTAIGDLNKDKSIDIVITLQHKDSISLVKSGAPEDTVLTQPRILVILFKNSFGNKFDLIEQNNSFILNHDNPAMDDPYQGLKIDKGILQINFHIFYNMGSWYMTTSSYKFRYQGKEFILIGADYSTIHRATLDFEDHSYNFLTKKRRLTKGNEQTEIKKTYWKSVKLPKLLSLKKLKEPFLWELENDIYL